MISMTMTVAPMINHGSLLVLLVGVCRAGTGVATLEASERAVNAPAWSEELAELDALGLVLELPAIADVVGPLIVNLKLPEIGCPS